MEMMTNTLLIANSVCAPGTPGGPWTPEDAAIFANSRLIGAILMVRDDREEDQRRTGMQCALKGHAWHYDEIAGDPENGSSYMVQECTACGADHSRTIYF